MNRSQLITESMEFKQWLYQEDTKLQRQFKTEGTEVLLGKFGRFKTTYIYKNGTSNRSKEAANIMATPAMEANRKLDYLGFPNVAVNTLIVDGYTDKNAVLGGGQQSAFAFASRGRHGMVLSMQLLQSKIIIDDIVHEYAHMYWHNSMSKMAKDLFINKHKELVNQLKPEELTNPEDIKKKLENYLTRRQFARGLYNKIKFYSPGFSEKTDIEDWIIKPENRDVIANIVNKYVSNVLSYGDLTDATGIQFLQIFPNEMHRVLPGKEVADILANELQSYAHFHQHQGTFDDNMMSAIIQKILMKALMKAAPNFANYAIQHISEPEGQLARDALYKKFNLPSSYSAANYDELWAETVEKASKKLRSVNPELLKLLKDAIFLSR